MLSDVNPGLVETYRAIRDNVDEVIYILDQMPYAKDFYYLTRASRPDGPAERAARFIYLNKTCFNGLYRENLNGEFNVPFGSHPMSIKICNSEQLRAASEALSSSRIDHGDFATLTAEAKPGDIVYCDPPYTTAHSDNGFVEYNARVFSWDDQSRLAQAAASLVEKGIYVAISNADHPSIVECYLQSQYFRTVRIARWSTIASRSSKRARTSELLILPK